MEKGKEEPNKEVDRVVSMLNSFSDNELKLIKNFIGFLEKKDYFEEEDRIPVSIFRNNELGPLETIVKFLKENKGLKYNEIGKILQRDPAIIGMTYRNTLKKTKLPLDVLHSEYFVPTNIFSKSYSTFESVVKCLKDTLNVPFKKIAEATNRNYRTVWTTYKRALKK